MPYRLSSERHNGFEKADLHIHTKCSDGIFTPEEIVGKAASSGLKAISITDHDSVLGIDKAKPLALQKGVELIPGVEMSSTYKGYDIHILGYFFDYQHSALKLYLDHCRHLRTERAERMVRSLPKWASRSRSNRSSSRPRTAASGDRILPQCFRTAVLSKVSAKHSANISVRTVRPTSKASKPIPAEVIRLINEASGLSFLAHPAQNVPDEILKQLITFGLDGLEIIHPSHDTYKQNYYREIANEYFLLFSGGSDYHGMRERDEDTFGRVTIPYEWVTKMKSRLVKA